jgi:hypothetical protein
MGSEDAQASIFHGHRRSISIAFDTYNEYANVGPMTEVLLPDKRQAHPAGGESFL